MEEQLRILAVDDEEDIRQVLKLLYGGSYAMDCVASLEDASGKLALGGYDLLILDQHLGDGEGTDLLAALRRDPAYAQSRDLPVIMLTAADTGQVYEASWDGGAVAFVKKPFEVPELTQAIERAAAQRGRSAVNGISAASLA